MLKKDYFKLGLLISAGVHFFLIVFFPMLPTSKIKKPEIMHVALITVELEEVKPKEVAAPPPAPPPKQVQEQKTPKISPVEVAVRTSQNIPVLTPRAEAKTELEISFPTLSFGPTISREKNVVYYEMHKEAKKISQGLPTDTSLPPKISSPIQGEAPSLAPSQVYGEGGTAVSSAQGPVGITFRGLGTRKIVYHPSFIYPEEMEKQGRQGGGLVEVDVAPNGHVVDVRIIQSAGMPQFDQEILRKARYYKFSPVDEPGIKTYPGKFSFRLKEK